MQFYTILQISSTFWYSITNKFAQSNICYQIFAKNQIELINYYRISSKKEGMNTDPLSKLYPSYPITSTKSPGKYMTSSVNVQVNSPTKNQWNSGSYSGLKKIPDSYQDLRQTFDTRTNNKIQQAIIKTSKGQFGGSKYDNFSKSQYNADTSSPSSINLASSAVYERSYKKDDPITSYSKTVKSPITDKKVDIDKKYQEYAQALEKFKLHAEETNKVSEQLKKLKEDRKKRMQAKQQLQSFKKKTNYDYYTPKQQKSSYLGSYTAAEPLTPKINLDKYKSSTVTSTVNTQPAKSKPTSKYDNYFDTKISSATSSVSSVNATLAAIQKKESAIYNGEVKDFILGKLLGQGKFGTVYQGFHKKTGSLYAIKKVPKDMIKSHLMIDQFLLQLKLQMFLNHENILTLFHFFDDRTHIYLVLQYMEQGTLFSHLKKNKTLPEVEVATKIKQIASAIKYLHENQIAHRDIKPQNIVMSHGVCKLCDFGWATVCDERRKTYCGTFDYAPPEILAGAQYDYTVDLWCLGVLTYELLVGKAPFYHISRKETMKKILNVEKTVIQFPDNISKNAKSFIQNLIKKDPKERIGSDLILEHPFLKNVPNVKMDSSLRKSSF